MEVELRHKYDLEIMRMSYDDFIQWRDSGYIEFLYQGLISHLNLSHARTFSIDADCESLNNFLNKKYDDYLVPFHDALKHTLRAVCRYTIVECDVDDYETWKRNKNLDTILD